MDTEALSIRNTLQAARQALDNSTLPKGLKREIDDLLESAMEKLAQLISAPDKDEAEAEAEAVAVAVAVEKGDEIA